MIKYYKIKLNCFQLPSWLHEAAHSAGGINGDRAVLLVVIALTLVLIHLIQTCVAR